MPSKIAIVGAGPAGCTLARLLQVSEHADDLEVTIFEGEDSIDFRSQGGTLDLHVKTGQAALKAAGLFDEFLKHARYDGEAMKFADKNLLVYVSQGQSKPSKSSTGRPEIDRPKLRQLLYESLRPETVRWSHKLQRVEEGPQGLTLHFANGSKSTGHDLVVGADGAWSRVRRLISDDKPFYSGIGGYAFSIPDAANNAPELSALVNRGSLFSWSDSKAVMAQQMGDGSLSVSTWRVLPENWQKECGYDVHDAKAVKQNCVREFADWDERLVRFTQAAEGKVTPRNLYMLPIGHQWKHKPGVTLIGDAAHLATPFAGEGVNLAMADALKLSVAISSAAESSSPEVALETSVADFEVDMFQRATEMQQLTYDMMSSMFFTPGAPRVGLERYLLRAVEGEIGWWMTRLIATPLVYTYYFFFKLIW